MTNHLARLAASSQNFGFLVQHDLRLAIDVAAAEIYLHTDPDAALGKLRRYGETLARSVSDRAGLNTAKLTQHNRINELAKAGVIPTNVEALLHLVRGSGNSAVHVASVGGRDPLPALRACFDLALWWHAELTGTPPAQPFVPPTPEPTESARMARLLKDLDAQISRLHATFEERGAAQAIRIAEKPPPSGRWEGGAQVSCQGRTYLLHDPVTALSAPDGSWRLLEAGGLSFDGKPDAVRLRKVVTTVATNDSKAVGDGLRAQTRLLIGAGGRKGLPRVDRSDSFTLITFQPEGTGWRERFGTGTGPLDPLIVPVALEALAAVADTLAELHRLGNAHRCLDSDSVIVSQRRGLLREAGMAALPSLPGEGGEYKAPEQKTLTRGRPGTHTDVFQLGALLLHTLLGFTPGAGQAIAAGLSPRLDELLLAALDNDPARRPSMSALAAGLKKGRHEISTGVTR